MKTHDLKIRSQYFKEVLAGTKTFEVRWNDRDYQVGDIMVLNEVDDGLITGNATIVRVTYIFHGGEYGLAHGYCIMAIEVIDP